MKTYMVNEMFYSLQGEGIRAGTPNVFVRFAGCNLTCNRGEHGFDCDTEFTSGVRMTGEEIVAAAFKLIPSITADKFPAVVFTGGEPLLQLDLALLLLFRPVWHTAIETNGTQPLGDMLNDVDWICVSPKTAEHTLRIERANEVKYVRRAGQGIPKPSVRAEHFLISPAFLPEGSCSRGDLEWCINLCRDNPPWRLSVQQHKGWKVR